VEKKMLEAIRVRLSKERLDADYRMAEGPAADNILAAAREFAADLIVIGAHEHGKFYRCIFGDTTDSLVRNSHCPVLIVPHIVDK
jgi:nucleotide-binding universal stress UspA family protein